MRIQSITSLNLWNSSASRNQAPRYQQPNFEGTLTVEQLKKMPLDKKLPHLFNNVNVGDIIAVGKNFEEVHKGLLKSISAFSDVIKRVFFIKHGGLAVPLAFGIDSDETISCTNIGNKTILVSTLDDAEDLEPTDSITIDEGDVIINNNVNIPIGIVPDLDGHIEDVEDMELLMNPDNFVTKTYNLDGMQQKWINDANTEALAALQKSQENDATKEDKVKKLTFADVGGMDKVIERLEDAILFPIRFAYAYEEDGVDPNKGVLLHGKPGTGKTLIAEALAGECDAKFMKLCGTDLETKWVGDTEAKWRELFKEAVANQPSIIFIDEFDAVVKERGRNAGSDYGDKVVNQILSLMSDLEKSDDKVFVIATTNKPETMDSAILRSGRFGEIIEVTEPDRNGKKAILDIHTRKKRLSPELDIEKLLDEFDKRNFTGADIKHITNKAHTNSWIRQGIREKMKDNTLTREDVLATNIDFEDFNRALKEWDESHQAQKKVRPVGYLASAGKK